MLQLSAILHLFIGASLSGAAVIAVLAAGLASVTTILAAALLGFVLAVPVTWWVARTLYRQN